MLAHRSPEGTAWIEWTPGSRLPEHLGGLWVSPRAEEVLTTQKLTALGLRRVTVDAVPEGRSAVGWSLQDVGGAPHLMPELAPPPTLEERKVAIAAAVTARRDAIIGGGVTIDFGEGFGPKRLQTATEYDRQNWLTILSTALAFSAMGAGAEPMNPIRTEDNTMVPCTVDQSIGWMLQVQSLCGGVWKHAALTKDAIAAAADDAALDAIDIEAGWPSI